jgi:TetR/AcrR family transcriptional regulator, cholesterol catabolism regulator
MVESMARTPKVVEDRREQIIDAAMQVFSEKGFTKATNKDVAREAGITPGLIYYYFESKEKLLEAMVESRSPIRLLTSLTPQVLALPPEAFLRFIIRQILSIIEGENFIRVMRVMLPEIVHNPEMTPMVAGFIQRVIGFLTSYLESKMEAGELRKSDASLAAQVFLGSVMGFVLRRHILRDPLALQYTPEQIADAIADTVFSGIAPQA